MVAGHFIAPNVSVAEAQDPAEILGIRRRSGYRAVDDTDRLRGIDTTFDHICERIKLLDLHYEDQCSVRYYLDLVRVLSEFKSEVFRVVEVGVYMGGSTGIFAGCSDAFGFDIDLVDINESYLQFAYERARRMYPAVSQRIRMFHGDLPSYVRHVMLKEPQSGYLVHHDGAHNFDQVVRDLSALSFVKDKLFAIIAQDTHLRGAIGYMNFVDLAIYAVFGTTPNYVPIGERYQASDPRTAPNAYEGNYFMPDAAEGMVLPIAVNPFRYPHPALKMEDFLPA